MLEYLDGTFYENAIKNPSLELLTFEQYSDLPF